MRPRTWTTALLCGALALVAGAARAADQAVLESDDLRVVVATSGGAHLEAFEARRQSRNLLRPGSRTPLYQIEIGGAAVRAIDAGQANETRLERPDPSTVIITSRHRKEGLEVLNTLRLPAGGKGLTWETEVRRSADGPQIRIVRTPGLALPIDLSRGGVNALAPVADGVVIEGLSASLRDGEIRGWNYPGMASAQLLALYDAKGGVVLWAEDATGQFKRLCLRRLKGDALVYFEHIVGHLEGPRIAVPYAVRIGTFEGGWERAADRYAAWARSQPWCARRLTPGARGAAGGPSFFLGANVREARGAGAVDRTADIPGVVASWSGGLGMPVTAILLSWEKHGAWIAPDAFPPYGGQDAFSGLVQGLHASGNRALMYLSGLNVTLEKSARNGAPAYKLPDAQRARYRPAATIGPNGDVFLAGSAAGEGIGLHATLCPSTPMAREVLETGFDACRALGADAVQVDQIVGGGTPPCYARDHGHPPVGGPSATTSLARMLDGLRQRKTDGRAAALVSLEEPGELFIPHVDLFHCRDYMQGMWPRDGRGVVGVPLFAYLYHDYARGYGGDSAPIAVRGEDPGLALYAQAMNLVAGRLPGAAVWMRLVPFDQVHPAQAAFMKDAAGLWGSEAGPYLSAGRIVDLGIDPGRQQVTGKVGGRPTKLPAPALMARGFDLEDGSRGVLYVNATGQPRETRLAFGPGRETGSAVSVWPEAGQRVNAGAARTLKPREILFLRLEGGR